MDKDKTDKNTFKFSKRFYFQVLIFLIVACVHFLITPMFEVENLSDFSADPKSAFVWFTLLQPIMLLSLLLESFIIKLSITFGIPFITIIYLSSSLMYGFMVALLVSEKIYLRVISIVLIVISIFLGNATWWFTAMIN